MLTWVKGSAILSTMSRKQEDATLDWLVGALEKKPPHRVNGTAVFLTGTPEVAPTALLHNLKHNHMLHERNIVLTMKTADVPRIPNNERVKIEKLSDSFAAVSLTYGFMETPSIEQGLAICRRRGLNIEMSSTSFFLSRRVLRPTSRSRLPGWQQKLFIWLAGSAEDAAAYFHIPSDRVVEIGTQLVV
jgi:KUP system potassium uptake protein